MRPLLCSGGRHPLHGRKPDAAERRPGFMPGGVPVHRNCVDPRICNLRGQRFRRFFSPLFVVVVIFGLDMLFNRVAYSTRRHDGHESHPLLLIRA